MDLFVRRVDATAGGFDQWAVKIETPLGPISFRFFEDALDSFDNKLPCGAAFSSSGLVDAPMKIAW
jgi:hypothetical protein